jgi:hypothetical protein
MAFDESAPGPTAAGPLPRPERRRYEKPKITDRGRLVEIALGGSPGTGDSGGGALVENPLV